MALDHNETISDVFSVTEVWDQEFDEEHSVECLVEKHYLNEESRGDMLQVEYKFQIER